MISLGSQNATQQLNNSIFENVKKEQHDRVEIRTALDTLRADLTKSQAKAELATSTAYATSVSTHTNDIFVTGFTSPAVVSMDPKNINQNLVALGQAPIPQPKILAKNPYHNAFSAESRAAFAATYKKPSFLEWTADNVWLATKNSYEATKDGIVKKLTSPDFYMDLACNGLPTGLPTGPLNLSRLDRFGGSGDFADMLMGALKDMFGLEPPCGFSLDQMMNMATNYKGLMGKYTGSFAGLNFSNPGSLLGAVSNTGMFNAFGVGSVATAYNYLDNFDYSTKGLQTKAFGAVGKMVDSPSNRQTYKLLALATGIDENKILSPGSFGGDREQKRVTDAPIIGNVYYKEVNNLLDNAYDTVTYNAATIKNAVFVNSLLNKRTLSVLSSVKQNTPIASYDSVDSVSEVKKLSPSLTPGAFLKGLYATPPKITPTILFARKLVC